MDERLRQASPVIVIGMHRSGTRLLADILTRLGVFMGADQQGDSESVTFMRLNEAIFHQCGTFWSEPMPVHVVLAQPEHVERIAVLARDTLTATLADYVGESGFSPERTDGATPPFGWKDPRNTFTLPVWKRVFPSLKALHIVRHGVDVAASLARRHRQTCISAAGQSVPSPLAVFEDHGFGVLSSRRGWTLAEAFGMWEQYVEKARLESAELGPRALEVCFEELLDRPDHVLPTIADFCGVELSRGDDALLAQIKSDRAFAFRRDPELVAFAETAREILRRYDYEP